MFSYQLNIAFPNYDPLNNHGQTDGGFWLQDVIEYNLNNGNCYAHTQTGNRNGPPTSPYYFSCDVARLSGETFAWTVTSDSSGYFENTSFLINGNAVYTQDSLQAFGCAYPCVPMSGSYMQSVFVGWGETNQANGLYADFTSGTGTMYFYGATYDTCPYGCIVTGESSNMDYSGQSGSGTSWSQTFAPSSDSTWSISLSSSSTSPCSGCSVTLTASTNANIGPTPYYAYIIDATTGVVVGGPYSTGSSWSTVISGQSQNVIQNYHAELSDYGPAQPEEAQSATVTEMWGNGWVISLASSNNSPFSGNSIVLTATTNMDVLSTPYWIYIIDSTTGSVVGNPCGSGTSCSVSTSQSQAVSQDYYAEVSDYGPSSPIEATSQTLSVSWNWIVYISASNYFPDVYFSTALTATTTQDVGPTPYYIYIVNFNTGSILATCSSGTTCSTSVTQSSATSVNYTAIIAGYNGSPVVFGGYYTTVEWVPGDCPPTCAPTS